MVAVMVIPLPFPVAAELNSNVVALVTEATVAPAGMFVPDTAIPFFKPAVEDTVTVASELVVAPAESVKSGFTKVAEIAEHLPKK